jgi:hypothetical protein
MTISDDRLPAMLAEGLRRLLVANEGARLDKRAVTAGYYAGAAIFAASQGKHEAMVETLTGKAQDAISRKGVQS